MIVLQSQPEHLVKMKEKHFKLPSISSDEAGSVGTSEMGKAAVYYNSLEDLCWYNSVSVTRSPAINFSNYFHVYKSSTNLYHLAYGGPRINH